MKDLFAYDGFPHSRHALKEVAKLAANGDAEVTIISVVPEAEARGSKAGRRRWLLPHAHQDVAIAHSYLHEQGVEAEMKIAYGDPADEIRKEAVRGGYGIIVLGSRGRDRRGRLLMGSVSKKLVDEVPCPVLIAGKDVTVRHEPPAPIRKAMLTLYQAEWCPHSHRVRQRLTELGVDYIAKQVPARREDRAELRRATGSDRVPVLLTDAGPLEGSDEILRYLAARFEESADAHAHRAQAREHAPTFFEPRASRNLDTGPIARSLSGAAH
jgi:nucleotide-binding universal stress UspA family protein/glutaredoxin